MTSTEAQMNTGTLAGQHSPSSKGELFCLQQHFLHEETPMKPSEINMQSHPPPRKKLPLQSPELYHVSRAGGVWPPPHLGFPLLSSSSAIGTRNPTNRSSHLSRERLGPPQFSLSPQPLGSFGPSPYVPCSLSESGPQSPSPGKCHISPHLMRDVSNCTRSFQIRKDQSNKHKDTFYSRSENVSAKNQDSKKVQSSDLRGPTSTAQPQKPYVTPSLKQLTGHMQDSFPCRVKDHKTTPSNEKLIPEDVNCSSTKRRRESEDCYKSPNISFVQTSKHISLQPTHKTSDSHQSKDSACVQSQYSTSSSTVEHTSKWCVKRLYVDLSRDHIVSILSSPKRAEERLNKSEENDKKTKYSSTSSPRVNSSAQHIQSTPVLPKSRSTSHSQVEQKKSARWRSRRPSVVPNDTDDLFTPDPLTCLGSRAHKTTKPDANEKNTKSLTPENSTANASSSSLTVTSCDITQSCTLSVSRTPEDANAPHSAGNPQLLSPTVTLMRLKLEDITFYMKKKTLKNSPVTPKGTQLKEEHSDSDGLSYNNVISEIDADPTQIESLPTATKTQAREEKKEDSIDMELGLDLSFALDLDMTQSSSSSDEEEQLLSLQEIMERAIKPPDTPEKEAFSEPSTPGNRCRPLTTTSSSTAKPTLYKNNLDQLLKEYNTHKKNKENEGQLLSTCQEDLLRIAEYEEDQEKQEEAITAEQQEFVQRYTLMTSAIRDVPPGETVFNPAKFGQIFNQDSLQLRQCNVTPQGTAQKTLLWSSPAQLRSHVTGGLFQVAYNRHSPCPALVSRFLFKMMSVHRERLICEKILEALCDIACSAALENARQEFKVWVPSLADVTLVLMNMGVSFVSLFTFENLQPPFSEADLLEDVFIKPESPCHNKEQRTFFEHNYNTMLKYLSFCMTVCPRAYSDDELLLLLTVLGRVSLDTQLVLHSSEELFPLQYKIINNFRDWDTVLARICWALTDLTDDHHNMCSLVRQLPDSKRGKELCQHLSLCMISKLIDGKCTYTPTENELQLSILKQYLPHMKPSAILRGMRNSSNSVTDNEGDTATLDQQSYYLCYSLLTLTNEASSFQSFPAHQKEQLRSLCSVLDTCVKCDIRESEKCLYRSKVKDLVARIYIKWQLLLQKTRLLNGELYDFWQPPQDRHSRDSDDHEDAEVGEGNPEERNQRT